MRRGDQEQEVTKTALDAAAIARLLAEVAPPGDASADRADERWEFDYVLDQRPFRFLGRRGPASWSASVTHEQEAAGNAVEIADVPSLLTEALHRKASDLHLSSGQPPQLRVDGELVGSARHRPPTAERLETLLMAITPAANREEFQAAQDTDFAYELPGKARFRVNLYREIGGIGAAFRMIPHTIPTVEDLGLPEIVRRIAGLSNGLVLVVGATGSGKSSTLAALLDQINRSRREHILTIEDPIEFVHRSNRSLVHQRQVGVHTRSFVSALRAALREDPDVVMVGELRDLETTSIAIKTAETGYLVFGTFHTTSAPGTVERVLEQYPADQQPQIRLMLAASLRAVIAQVLLKRVGGGRVAAFETLLVTPGISNMIREGKVFQIPSAMQTGRKLGMSLLDDSLAALVESGAVEAEEAYRKASHKEGFADRLRAAGKDLSFLDEQARAGAPEPASRP